MYGLKVIFPFQSMSMQNICKSPCFALIWDLKRLRGYLTLHAALMAANAVIGILFIYLFNWGFTLLSTLYRSYHDG